MAIQELNKAETELVSGGNLVVGLDLNGVLGAVGGLLTGLLGSVGNLVTNLAAGLNLGGLLGRVLTGLKF